ncbi:hypothetical protein EON67_07650, partial [archaeon]
MTVRAGLTHTPSTPPRVSSHRAVRPEQWFVRGTAAPPTPVHTRWHTLAHARCPPSRALACALHPFARVTVRVRACSLSVTKVNPYHSDGNAFNITFPGSNCDIGTKCAPVGSTAEEGYTPLEVHGLQNLTPGEYRPIFELSLGNCEQLPYETGDHIAILPENLMECVYRLCDRLCWDPDTTIALESATGMANSKLPFTGATTIGDMLRTRFDLNAAVTPHMIRTLASFSTKAEHAEALNKLTERTEYISG